MKKPIEMLFWLLQSVTFFIGMAVFVWPIRAWALLSHYYHRWVYYQGTVVPRRYLANEPLWKPIDWQFRVSPPKDWKPEVPDEYFDPFGGKKPSEITIPVPVIDGKPIGQEASMLDHAMYTMAREWPQYIVFVPTEIKPIISGLKLVKSDDDLPGLVIYRGPEEMSKELPALIRAWSEKQGDSLRHPPS